LLRVASIEGDIARRPGRLEDLGEKQEIAHSMQLSYSPGFALKSSNVPLCFPSPTKK
jgi:hypothetical protein